jgi:hypothetical protein
MAAKTIFVSDISGREIRDEQDAAQGSSSTRTLAEVS